MDSNYDDEAFDDGYLEEEFDNADYEEDEEDMRTEEDDDEETEEEEEDELDEAEDLIDMEMEEDEEYDVENIGVVPEFKEPKFQIYKNCEDILKGKNAPKSEILKNEFRKLYHYRTILQKSDFKEKVKAPFDIKSIISTAKLYYNEAHDFGSNEDYEKYRENLVTKIDEFCKYKLIRIYGNFIPKSYVEICSEGLYPTVILIRTELASIKIERDYKIGMKGLDYCLEAIYKKCLRGIIDAGENIGTAVATGIAEPSTQLTLNTFHYAGVAEKSKVNNTTKRLEQILNASKTIKPQDVYMTMHLKDGINEEDAIRKITMSFDNNIFNDFVREYQIIQDDLLLKGAKGTSIPKDKKIIAHFLKYNTIPKNPSILCLRVKINIKTLFVKKMNLETLEAAIRSKFPNAFIVSSGIGIIRIYLENISLFDEIEVFKNMIEDLENLRVTGTDGVLGIELGKVFRTSYNDKGEVKKEKIPVVYTTGSNFSELCKYSHIIDVYKSYTNNINEIYSELGVGAVKNILFDEIIGIFRANGINISPENILLLVDQMTSQGVIAPVTRSGLFILKSSTLQSVSFEMPLRYMKESALLGNRENVKGTSDNIIFAQPVSGGTSSFTLCMTNMS